MKINFFVGMLQRLTRKYDGYVKRNVTFLDFFAGKIKLFSKNSNEKTREKPRFREISRVLAL